MIRRTGYTKKDIKRYVGSLMNELDGSISKIVGFLKKNDIAADVYWEWLMVIGKDVAIDEDEANDFFAEVATEIEGTSVAGRIIESHSGDGSLHEQDDQFYANYPAELSGTTPGDSTPTDEQIEELDEIVNDYGSDLQMVVVWLYDEDGNRYVEISTIDEPMYAEKYRK